MKVAKNNTVILKRFNKKPISLDQLPNSTQKSSTTYHSPQFSNKRIQIGSSLPNSSLSFYSAPKPIRPPSEIFAQPILRAAFEIDMQTASIPWEDIDLTLQSSKASLARVREIRKPLKREIKKCPTVESISYSEKNFEDYLKSHRSSIREEIKTIFNPEEAKQEPNTKQLKKRLLKSATLGNLSKKFRPATTEKAEDMMKGTLLIKKFDNDRTKTAMSWPFCSNSSFDLQNNKGIGRTCSIPVNISVQIKKKNVVISESAAFQLFDGFSIFPDSGVNAPFAGRMKGNKVKSKFGAMFIPSPSVGLTPNHFLNINE